MWQLRVRGQIMATMSLLFALLISFDVANARGSGLPNVMVLATGGTIAGTGASSTTVVGYTAATVGIETLLNAVPELKTVANVKGEQVFPDRQREHEQ
ncbi:L-asparaginase/Glu-tRNA(Gln) amidotransferase subunit D [Bradyrhizobium sp. LM3.6]